MTDEPERESIIDQLRHSPMGTNDPNIVGDAGPNDVRPGRDPHGGVIETTEDDERGDPGTV